MKVIIAGSRHFLSKEIILPYIEGNEITLQITEVVSGGAGGVDRIGIYWAVQNNIPIKYFWPNWKKFGRAAGPIRNEEMAKYADALILIWDGKSRGSLSMKNKAELNKIPIYEKIITTYPEFIGDVIHV